MSTVPHAQPASYGSRLRHGVLAASAVAAAIVLMSGVAPERLMPASLLVIALLVGAAQQALP